MPVGAIVGAGVLGAGASIYGANKQSKAANNAANLQMQQYQQTRADLAPYREAGAMALPGIQRLLGLGPEGSAGIQAQLESLPGYQFTRDQGIKGITNTLSARGLSAPTSGAFGKGLARFVTGLADQTYGSQLERLMGLGNMGASAATQGGQIGGNAAAGAAGNIVGAGNAQAAGALGAASNLGGALMGYGYGPAIRSSMYGGGASGGSLAGNVAQAAWSNPFLF